MSLPKCFLEGKVAIVTGASSGIGEAVAERLAHAGVNVVLAARSAERLAEARARIIERAGVRALAVPCDVTRLDDLQRLLATAVDELGGVDILINNAGVDAFRSFHELDPLELQRTVQVNLLAALQLTRLTLPQMLQRGWGHIVNMSSLAGKFGPPGAGAYAATKAGLIAFTQSLRGEYRSLNVSATAVCPGFTLASGIYDQICADVGREPPSLLGRSTVDRVARATVRAIRKDQPEAIVNVPPYRAFYALTALFPRAGEWIFRKLAGRYFRDLARARSQSTPLPTPEERRAA